MPPPSDRLDEHVLRAAEAARWAPSLNNSQPWRFRRLPHGLRVMEDPGRLADRRSRVLACGAAALNARVTLQALGHAVEVDTDPALDAPTLVATVRTADGSAAAGATDPLTGALAAAVWRRRTHRRIYRSHAVAEDDLLVLSRAVRTEGARLSVLDSRARRELGDLVRATAAGPKDAATEDPSTPHADSLSDLARSTVLVITTDGDTRRDAVLAGMALERLLLEATVRDLVASFVDQLLLRDPLRPENARAFPAPGTPHVVLRIGRALTDPPPVTRLPLEDLFG